MVVNASNLNSPKGRQKDCGLVASQRHKVRPNFTKKKKGRKDHEEEKINKNKSPGLKRWLRG